MLKRNIALITHGAAIILALAFAWVLHDWRMLQVDANHQEELLAQQTTLIAECDTQKEEIYAVSDKYQKSLGSNRAEFAKLKRMYDRTTCVVPKNTASGLDATTRNSELPASDGITVEALLEFGADAEAVGLALDACQDWLTRQRVND